MGNTEVVLIQKQVKVDCIMYLGCSLLVGREEEEEEEEAGPTRPSLLSPSSLPVDGAKSRFSFHV